MFKGFRRENGAPSPEKGEHEPLTLEALRRKADIAFRDLMDQIASPELEGKVREAIEKLASSFEGLKPENIRFMTESIGAVGSSGTITISEKDTRPVFRAPATDSSGKPYGVAMAAMFVAGVNFFPGGDGEKFVRTHGVPHLSQGESGAGEQPFVASNETAYRVGGDPELSRGKYGPATQPPVAPSESRPDAMLDESLKPEHAPSGYGVHQWEGTSEYNSEAVAWLAIKNVGNEPCRVEVTRLELSYKMPDGAAVLGATNIVDVQVLADGTDGTYWGQHLGGVPSGSTFDLPPNRPEYLHPFGVAARVPSEAEQMTITFSAEITEGCIVGAGMDTYPLQNPAEAIKTPWIDTSVHPEDPISFAIVRKSIDE